ncbi:MAG: serine--tRNA ligase [Acidobacteria bacterium]|nr:MAG: serine--tRNA ligase [Acidobacteriota bacterium]PIE89731.1 MAG: serine--tRNA ligase [Acidobacteriota bacterium]
MLDIKYLRDNLDSVKDMLEARSNNLDLSDFTELDKKRRTLIQKSDELKNERKTTSKSIGALIKKGENVDHIKQRVQDIGSEIKVLDQAQKETVEALADLVNRIPNMLHPTVPLGSSEDDNVKVSEWGQPGTYAFDVKDHVELGSRLGILDMETATKLTGARFALLRGQGAQLERALVNFMIDVHVEQGYFEVLPPFIVNGDSMYGTGQFPKMKEDVFQLQDTDYYLIPTAEVPVTNIHRGEILQKEQLPIYYQAFTPCFRSEAGSHGKDTRGLIRQHQFNKVELVKFVHPSTGEEELEKLLKDAEEILRRLQLPYRVVQLCSADLSFSAAKCYDIEVWLPGQDRYREISSCSLFTDFQARRAKIRFKEDGRNQFVHTLNGSGLAVGRTLVAILENYQQEDGTISIPDALIPYMGGVQTIGKQII